MVGPAEETTIGGGFSIAELAQADEQADEHGEQPYCEDDAGFHGASLGLGSGGKVVSDWNPVSGADHCSRRGFGASACL